MKFNTPPNWPAPPEGFAPGPDWTPDPSLPAPPPGWQLWVDDDVALPGETTQALRHHKQAITSFWVGVAFFAATAIAAAFISSTGVLWYGGLIFGAISLVRAGVTYRASRKDGAPALTGTAKGLAVVGLVVALGAGAYTASTFYTTETTNTEVGSCWTISGSGDAKAVSCDDTHDYTAVSEVKDAADCPNDEYLEAKDGSDVLCLQKG